MKVLIPLDKGGRVFALCHLGRLSTGKLCWIPASYCGEGRDSFFFDEEIEKLKEQYLCIKRTQYYIASKYAHDELFVSDETFSYYEFEGF